MLKVEQSCARFSRLLLIAVAIVICFTFQDYGITWDEELQSQYGQAVLNYYLSGFHDTQFDQIFNLYLYGGLFDGFAALVNYFAPIDVYPTRHILNAFFGLLALWGTWRIGRLLGGGRVGALALFMLVFTPVFYGHMFNNPKDIPFAAGIVWSLYYMLRCQRIFPALTPMLFLKLAIILGLTLGVRVGGVMVLGYWGLTIFLQAMLISRQRIKRLEPLFLFSLVWRFAALTGGVLILTYAVMLLCWPWAQEQPFKNPWLAFVQFSNFPQIVDVLFNGVTYSSTNLPWDYVPLYFAVQLPVLNLLLISAALLLLPYCFFKLNNGRENISLLLLIMTVTVPVVYAMVRHPALYDAIRHFTFTLPVLSIIGALIAVKMWDKFFSAQIIAPKIKKICAFSAAGVVLLSGITTGASMARLHPYEYIYVNPFFGGVSGAFGRFELDYWGSSFKEAADKLQKFVAAEGGVPPGQIYRIAICGPWSAAMIYLPPDFEGVEADEKADFFLSTTRWMCHKMRKGNEIVRISRMGAPLSIINDLRGNSDNIP